MRAPAPPVQPVDFRRPSRIGRDAIVALENRHEAFARRLATVWSGPAQATVEVEHVSTDQLSMDDFTRSMPAPTALGTVRIDRLGAHAFVEVDLPLALVLIERIMGGVGNADLAPVVRRPTDLEIGLIAHTLLHPVVDAIDTALDELDGEPSTLTSVDTAPQSLQLGAQSDLLLLLGYRVELRGDLPAQGMVTIAYPVSPLIGGLARLTGSTGDGDDDPKRASTLRTRLLEATVDLHLRLTPSALPAATAASLEVGDVLRLDHPAARPALVVIDDDVVGTAHPGRRGRRLAMQVDGLFPPRHDTTLSRHHETTEAQ